MILWRQLRRGWLIANHESEFWNQIYEKLPVWAERLQQRIAPLVHLHRGSAKNLMDKTLEGLSQRPVGNAAFILIKLAGAKETTARHQDLVQLIHNGRFPNA